MKTFSRMSSSVKCLCLTRTNKSRKLRNAPKLNFDLYVMSFICTNFEAFTTSSAICTRIRHTFQSFSDFKNVVQPQYLLTDVFQNLRLAYISCKYFKSEKNIPFSIFSRGYTFKGFDRQTWFVNCTHFRLAD